MIKLHDGPAEGVYPVRRAPLYLRAVVNEDTGGKDVLDLLVDEPERADIISVYRRVGPAGTVHINMGGTRKGSGFYATGEYIHLADVDGGLFRETPAWQDWCRAQLEGAI